MTEPNADYVRRLLKREMSAIADGKAATDPADAAYWKGVADAYEDAINLAEAAQIDCSGAPGGQSGTGGQDR